MSSKFLSSLRQQWNQKKFVCVGLDPDLQKIPAAVKKTSVRETLTSFNIQIIDATHDLVAAYKPNSAFYEAHGVEGIQALQESIQHIRKIAPHVLIVLDAKRADIGNTNQGYVRSAFEDLDADAITVHPYLGAEALEPFLALRDKGVIVLCRTSNPGAREFQDLKIDGKPLYQIVADRVAKEWNQNGNCALVVGATYPEELAEVRGIVPDLPILIPGIGAQGGDLEKTVRVGRDQNGQGILINVGRSVLYASSGVDFAQAARVEVEKLNRGIGNI